MSDKPKIMIAVPNTGWIHKGVVSNCLSVVTKHIHEYEMRYYDESIKCNEANYQHHAKLFWENGYDWLLQVDSDNPWMYGVDPLELIQHNKDIIALPTPVWVYDDTGKSSYRPFQWNVYRKVEGEKNPYKTIDPPHDPGQALHQIDAAGAGCMLISARVFKAPLMKKEAWHRKWDSKTGTVTRGLDLAFCERAKKCGFEVWTHWDYKCHHFKEVDLLRVLEGYHTWLVSALEENAGNLNIRDIVPAEVLQEKFPQYA